MSRNCNVSDDDSSETVYIYQHLIRDHYLSEMDFLASIFEAAWPEQPLPDEFKYKYKPVIFGRSRLSATPLKLKIFMDYHGFSMPIVGSSTSSLRAKTLETAQSAITYMTEREASLIRCDSNPHYPRNRSICFILRKFHELYTKPITSELAREYSQLARFINLIYNYRGQHFTTCASTTDLTEKEGRFHKLQKRLYDDATYLASAVGAEVQKQGLTNLLIHLKNACQNFNSTLVRSLFFELTSLPIAEPFCLDDFIHNRTYVSPEFSKYKNTHFYRLIEILQIATTQETIRVNEQIAALNTLRIETSENISAEALGIVPHLKDPAMLYKLYHLAIDCGCELLKSVAAHASIEAVQQNSACQGDIRMGKEADLHHSTCVVVKTAEKATENAATLSASILTTCLHHIPTVLPNWGPIKDWQSRLRTANNLHDQTLASEYQTSFKSMLDKQVEHILAKLTEMERLDKREIRRMRSELVKSAVELARLSPDDPAIQESVAKISNIETPNTDTSTNAPSLTSSFASSEYSVPSSLENTENIEEKLAQLQVLLHQILVPGLNQYQLDHKAEDQYEERIRHFNDLIQNAIEPFYTYLKSLVEIYHSINDIKKNLDSVNERITRFQESPETTSPDTLTALKTELRTFKHALIEKNNGLTQQSNHPSIVMEPFTETPCEQYQKPFTRFTQAITTGEQARQIIDTGCTQLVEEALAENDQALLTHLGIQTTKESTVEEITQSTHIHRFVKMASELTMQLNEIQHTNLETIQQMVHHSQRQMRETEKQCDQLQQIYQVRQLISYKALEAYAQKIVLAGKHRKTANDYEGQGYRKGQAILYFLKTLTESSLQTEPQYTPYEGKEIKVPIGACRPRWFHFFWRQQSNTQRLLNEFKADALRVCHPALGRAPHRLSSAPKPKETSCSIC